MWRGGTNSDASVYNGLVHQLTIDCHAHHCQSSAKSSKQQKTFLDDLMKRFKVQDQGRWVLRVVCFGETSFLLFSSPSCPVSRWFAVCGTISTQVDFLFKPFFTPCDFRRQGSIISTLHWHGTDDLDSEMITRLMVKKWPKQKYNEKNASDDDKEADAT